MSVSIVIPLYGRADLTEPCVEAIVANASTHEVEIVLVDNASPDRTGEVLDGLADRCTLVRNEQNLGFAKGSNQGAWAASGEVLVFLNNDTIVQPGWLDPLVAALDQPDVELVGSRLTRPDGSLAHAGIAIVHALGVDPVMTAHNLPIGGLGQSLADRARPVQAVTGACLAMRREAFLDIGGFDTEYWNGGEDVDLCLRAGALGATVMFEPASSVVHLESQSGPERFREVRLNEVRLSSRWAHRVEADLLVDERRTPLLAPDGPLAASLGGDRAGFELADAALVRAVAARIAATGRTETLSAESKPVTPSVQSPSASSVTAQPVPVVPSARAKPTVSGVNLIGFLRSESGVGEMARLALACLERAGIPTRAIPLVAGAHRNEHPIELDHQDPVIHPVNLFVINADLMGPLLSNEAMAQLHRGRRNIAYWAWEVESFPARMARAQSHVDEIWALSEFAATAIAAQVDVPVRALPLPILDAELAPPPPEGPFSFLFAFDFCSIIERKNPEGVVAAFRRAFAPGEAALTIKTVNADKAPDKHQALRALIGDHPDITLLDGYLDVDEHAALVARHHAYVSLHRAEGFGLTISEAMAVGRPVIHSAYGGPLEFTSPTTSFWVPGHPVEIPESARPYPAGTPWFEPDIEAAAAQMRWVRDNPDHAVQVAAAARQILRSRHGLDARAGLIADLLAAPVGVR